MLKIFNKRYGAKGYKDFGLYNQSMINKLNLDKNEIERRFKKIGYQSHQFKGYDYAIFEDLDNSISITELNYLTNNGVKYE